MKTASMPPGEYTPKPTFTKIKKAREAVPKIKESENFKTSLLTKSNIKTIIPKTFSYETTRAIVFQIDDKVPTKELKHCISLALTYHKVKNLPRLGVS